MVIRFNAQKIILIIFIFSLFSLHNSLAQTAEDYVNQGLEKSKKGDTKGAILDFNKAIGLDPKQAKIYYYRGEVKFDNQDYQEAIVDFSKTIELEPTNSLAYYKRGKAIFFLIKDNEDFKDAKDAINDAISDLDKSLELDPENGAVYFIRGYAKIVLRQVDDGCLDFSKAKELGYKNPYNIDLPKIYCR